MSNGKKYDVIMREKMLLIQLQLLTAREQFLLHRIWSNSLCVMEFAYTEKIYYYKTKALAFLQGMRHNLSCVYEMQYATNILERFQEEMCTSIENAACEAS